MATKGAEPPPVRVALGGGALLYQMASLALPGQGAGRWTLECRGIRWPEGGLRNLLH